MAYQNPNKKQMESLYTKIKFRKMSTKGKNKTASDYFRSGGCYLDSCCNVLLSFKCILNPIENNYFNSGRYFNSGCDVKLSLKFTQT